MFSMGGLVSHTRVSLLLIMAMRILVWGSGRVFARSISEIIARSINYLLDNIGACAILDKSLS
jgi:hypothetical protein